MRHSTISVGAIRCDGFAFIGSNNVEISSMHDDTMFTIFLVRFVVCAMVTALKSLSFDKLYVIIIKGSHTHTHYNILDFIKFTAPSIGGPSYHVLVYFLICFVISSTVSSIASNAFIPFITKLSSDFSSSSSSSDSLIVSFKATIRDTTNSNFSS